MAPEKGRFYRRILGGGGGRVRESVREGVEEIEEERQVKREEAKR